MSDCVEVVFVSDTTDAFEVIDPRSGSDLMSYKNGGGPSPRTMSLINQDYLISADSHQPLLRIWQLNSQEPSSELKMVVNGKVRALAMSPDGLYCIAGIESKLFIWEVSSGCLLNVVTKHFQDVTNIKFINYHHFVSAGEDGVVLVWKLAKLIQNSGHAFQDASLYEPLYNFSDDSLGQPISDIFVGTGGMRGRLYTVSRDQTCRIYCLASGQLLMSLVFSEQLRSITVDSLDAYVYVGTEGGSILRTCLEPLPRSLEYHTTNEDSVCFQQHTKAITCLSLSIDSVTLLSGSEDEYVIIWDVLSAQWLRIISYKGPVTNAFFTIASINIFNEKFKPQTKIKKFQRTINTEELIITVAERKEDVEVWPVAPIVRKTVGELFDSTSNNESLEAEVKRLRSINKQLYLFSLDNFVNDPMKYAGVVASNSRPTSVNGSGSSNERKKKKRKRGYPSKAEYENSD